MSKYRAVVAGLLAVLVSVLVAGCGGGKKGETVDGVKVLQKGKLLVCTHLPYKPFQYRNSSGKIVGFDVDLIGLLSSKLKLDQETVDVDWNQVTSGAAFKAKKCDLGMGGMTITPERAKAITISTPYFNATQALLVKKNAGIKSLADLKGKKLGAQSDTTGLAYAQKYQKQYGYQIVNYDDFSLEVNAVKAGTIAAAINDNGVLYDFAKDNPTTSVAKEFNTGEKYGFAALKNDANATKLMGMLDTQIKDSRTNGKYNQIYQRWFGTVPGNVNK